MTNELLIKRAQRGEPRAFEELMTPYEGMIWRICWHYLENREDAQDAAQEVMLRAWRGLPAFRGEASLETWLYRLCVSACTDALRRRKLRVADSVDALLEEGREPASDAPGPEEQTERGERHEQLRIALRQLPEEMRTPLILAAIEGLSYEEISHTLNINLGTVKSRINRARKQLAEILQNGELSPDSCVQQSERRAQK